METRHRRAIFAFFALFTAYWAYCLALVPLIEPSVAEWPQDEAAYASPGLRANERLLAELGPLFAPEAWEMREKAMILRSGPIRLLMQEYDSNRDDGKLLIEPCTIVYLPETPGLSRTERLQRAVVLQAPAGALLDFEDVSDIVQGKLNGFLGGQLRGDVVIRSGMRKPGPEDNLRIETRDVQLSKEDIYAPYDVEFRLGESNGSGRRMRIDFTQEETVNGNSPLGEFDVAGIEEVQMDELDHLHLVPARNDEPDSNDIGMAGASPSEEDEQFDSRLPIDIRCEGYFRFLPGERLAKFVHQVHVSRQHPDHTVDTIDCEELQIMFCQTRDGVVALDQPREEESEGSTDFNAFSLKPRAVVVTGMPAVISMPSEEVEARGNRIEYDMHMQRIVVGQDTALQQPGGQVDGAAPRVMLRQGPHTVNAGYVKYEKPPGNAVGLLTAIGPGTIRGTLNADEYGQGGDPYTASWPGVLELRPDGAEHVLSAKGGLRFESPTLGKLAANEMYFWLREAPTTPDADASQERLGEFPELLPDRALMRGAVDVDSPSFSCDVDTLEMWFEQIAASRYYTSQEPGQSGATPSAASPGASPNQPIARKEQGQGPQDERKSHFAVSGDTLRLEFLVDESETKLDRLAVTEHVRLIETRTEKPGQRPILLTGKQVNASKLSSEEAEMIVLGDPERNAPAHFEGRGLALNGWNICVSRGVNRVYINGPGSMQLTPPPEEPSPLGAPERVSSGTLPKISAPLLVEWRQGMDFNGETAEFHGDVDAKIQQQGTHRHMQTPSMRVFFNRKLRMDGSDNPLQADGSAMAASPGPFSPYGEEKPFEPIRLECVHDVSFESREFVDRRLVAQERMSLKNLTYHLKTREILSTGSGWLKSHRWGDDSKQYQELAGATAERFVPDNRENATGKEGITYRMIEFRDRLRGNMTEGRSEIHVEGDVLCVQGPVERWTEEIDETRLETSDPDALVILLTCQDLLVSEMPTSTPDETAIELMASGNAVIESSSFDARGERMKYAQQKDLLIIEGNQYDEAVLYHEQYPGAEPTRIPGRRITFRPEANEQGIEGVRELDLRLR